MTMKLEAIYDHLLTRARASGRDQHADLPGGARLAVRVTKGEGRKAEGGTAQIVVSVARSPQKVGDRELIVFHQVCRVPAQARRIPEEGQAERKVGDRAWWTVGWCWEEEQADG